MDAIIGHDPAPCQHKPATPGTSPSHRRAFVVFGAIGVNVYIGHLAYDLFANSLIFPFVLSFMGLLVIAGGVFYQRRSEKWRAAILGQLPAAWREYLP